jgi:hypothetical protein
MRWFSKWLLAYTLLCVAVFAFAGKDGQPQQRPLENSPMKISFLRTGGFAGLRLATTIDSTTLSPEETAHLRMLVENAGFFALPASLKAKASGADRFQYTITIETPEQQHTVTADESAVSPALRQLLNWLTKAASIKKP